MYTLMELSSPKSILFLGASNASIIGSMYAYQNYAKVHIVEEHEAILQHVQKKAGVYKEGVTTEIVSTIEEKVQLEAKFKQPLHADLDVAEEYRNKHDMLLSKPWEGERVTSRYKKVTGKYDFVVVDGPRKSGLGRALPLMEDILEEKCLILWMNGMHDLVIEAIKYFDHDARYYDNSLSSFHLDTRDGLVITRILDEEII